MAQYQEISHIFSAAGGTTDPKSSDAGSYLLFTEGSRLVSKFWNGQALSGNDTITEGVRPDSVVVYLIKVSTIFCISDQSKLRALYYDEDEDSWLDKDIPSISAHPESQLTAFSIPGKGTYVFLQDPSNNLIYIDVNWESHIIKGTVPITGSPLSAQPSENGPQVFYISSLDGQVHYATQAADNTWSDEIMAKVPIDNPKRLQASLNEKEALEAYVLTKDDELALITSGEEGKLDVLGKVDSDGNLTPSTSAQCGGYYRRRCCCCRRWHCCCW